MSNSNFDVKTIDLPPPKTVREALDRYRELGEGSIYKGYRDIIKALAKSGYDKPICNDSYADALFLTDIMLEHTESEFRMLGGSACGGFLSALKEQFREMLLRLTAVGGKARVIILRHEDQPSVVPSALKDLATEFSVLEFASGVTSAPQKHYIVSDARMLRVEDEHPPLTDDTDASAVKALVYFNNPVRGAVAQSDFDRVWNILRPKHLARSIGPIHAGVHSS